MYIQRGVEMLAGGRARWAILVQRGSQWNGEMQIVL
jgi:hypothetical protein